MITVPGEVVEPADLDFLNLADMAAPVADSEPLRQLHEARDGWERRYIVSALAACDGNMSRTAEVLGIERSNLYKKMRNLGISPGRE
jgi:two-component system nitrogen regulation response regulator NtrX